MKNLAKSLKLSLEKFFSWFSLVILSAMLLITITQIFLRNLFGINLTIAGEIARQGVIWLTFTGGILTTLAEKHIAIDIMPRFLKGKVQKILLILTNFTAVMITGFLAYFSVNFLKFEIEFASKIADQFPAWTFQIIIPIGFTFIALAFLLNIFDEKETP
ncbi:MAG: TRAP transporter small permease subunit [Candidatus Marinimicrobia bacterium]|nr:TRAP transporter small permease subunit [Candidatus Neomarinimicrobiota bacterium]